MNKKLLIDAHQPEETRVVLLNDQKIEEFDYENTARKQLKGNVYLARITRVEPSLQAAFVEYGGNRQGFLAFSEIHPDYYRIPIEDREALQAEVEPLEEEYDEASATQSDTLETIDSEEEIGNSAKKALPTALHKYKIQEVISRKQILLVQVVKEERGNKGAALTTYLSLAGRYCVLMPNSNRGGGVSRKINNPADRKRLKSVVSELDIADGMAVIVRTAGSKRTKTEIKRDYSYLTKLWNDIRSNTMKSEAPSLIHEEGSLVKRAIRDIYTNDIEEVYVEGAESYKIAKTHMKMLIPSHAKRVVEFKGDRRLFQHHQVEAQLDQIHHNQVTLKSGGYLVLNQTEALVAIDVNSGKATRERNIEETAVKTNLEAAEEIGRQLKLRDLSGLVVIDFIDMEENRNQHLVERRLKEALRNDRARIQVGGISHFGLLEMSRQRLRPSLVESISQACHHCEGTGRVRSVNSSALHVLRVLEEEITGISEQELSIVVQTNVALYILNEKRATLSELEKKANCKISIRADATLLENDYQLLKDNVLLETKETQVFKNKTETAKGPNHPLHPSSEDDTEDGDQPKRKRRGRRGGRRRRRRDGDETFASQTPETETETKAVRSAEAGSEEKSENPSTSDMQSDKTQTRPKSRKRRGNKPKQNQQPLKAADDTAAIGKSEENSSETQTSDKTPKAGLKLKKARKKSKSNSVADNNADYSDANKTARPKSPKTQTKKAGVKKSVKKAVKRKQKPAEKQTSENSIDTSQQLTGREPIASVDLGVTNVGNNAPAAKKRGWWTKN